MNETVVTVVGNVASDLRTRRVAQTEERVVGFRVAASERRWDRASESWVDGDRFSAWVSCWRRLGDGVLASLAKGDPVVVSGRLSVREYEGPQGERRFSTEIAASAVGPDLSRSTAAIARRRLSVVAGTGEGAEGPEGAEGAGDAEGGAVARGAGPGTAGANREEHDEEDPEEGADEAPTGSVPSVASAG